MPIDINTLSRFRARLFISTLRLVCINDKFSHWQSWEYINFLLLLDLASGSTSIHLFSLCKMYLGTLALIDINGEFASHWLTTFIKVSNPMTSLHAWHQHIIRMTRIVPLGFLAGEDYIILAFCNRYNRFSSRNKESTFTTSSTIYATKKQMKFYILFHDPVAITTSLHMHSLSTS